MLSWAKSLAVSLIRRIDGEWEEGCFKERTEKQIFDVPNSMAYKQLQHSNTFYILLRYSHLFNSLLWKLTNIHKSRRNGITAYRPIT